MKSFPASLTPVESNYVLQIDASLLISNALNIIIHNNHRPTMFRDLTDVTMRQWRSKSYIQRDGSQMLRLAEQFQAGRPPSPATAFLQDYKDVASALMSEPTYHRDAGEALRDCVTRVGTWGVSYVALPALGTARAYYQLRMQGHELATPFTLPSWTPASGDALRTDNSDPMAITVESAGPSGLRDVIANIAMAFDRPAISADLVPDSKTAASPRESREAFWGQATAALNQVDRLRAIGLLWCRQLDAFALRMHDPMWDLAFELAHAQFPRERPILERYAELRSAVRDLIPIHPFLESVTNLINQVSLSTYWGTKRAAFRFVSVEQEQIHRGRQSAMAQRLMLYAMAEYANLRSLATGANAWPVKWAADNAPDLSQTEITGILRSGAPAPGEPTDTQTYSDVLEWAAVNEKLVAMWADVARSLNWSGAVPAQAYTVDAAGADFMVTDGQGFSDNPAAAIAGLRPLLSLGNIQASGFERRMLTNFGLGKVSAQAPELDNGGVESPMAFSWSTIVAKGHTTALKGKDAYIRFYMPPGMWMGEPGVMTRFAGGMEEDPIGQMVVGYYMGASPGGYVKENYSPPRVSISRTANGATYMVTSWDAVAVSSNAPDNAQTALLAGYGEQNTSKKLDYYFYSPDFKLRTPVAMTRAPQFDVYDELGAFVETKQFDGHILFGGDIALPNDSSVVDAYVDLLRVTAPALGIVNDPVTPPTEV